MSVTTRSMRSSSAAAAVAEEEVVATTEELEEEEVYVPGTPPVQQADLTGKVYALTPALISHEAIDYSTSAGAKLYKQAVEN